MEKLTVPRLSIPITPVSRLPSKKLTVPRLSSILTQDSWLLMAKLTVPRRSTVRSPLFKLQTIKPTVPRLLTTQNPFTSIEYILTATAEIKHVVQPIKMDYNFLARMRHGNRKQSGIGIGQWNAGHGYLCNKMPEVCHIIQEKKFMILGISESSYHASQDIGDIQLDDYELYLPKTISNPNIQTSRIAVYVHKDLTVKVRNDLMNDVFSSVWLELGRPRQKKILLCTLYRDWKYLGQEDDSSSSIGEQMSRWVTFLDQWEQAIPSGKEICVLGDVNLNFLKWMNPNNSLSSHAKKLQPLVTALFDKIMPYGFVQLVSQPTRFMPGMEPSGLDHVYTNHPEHMSKIQVRFQGGSDHRLVSVTRYTKSIIRKTRIIKRRSYKNFDPRLFLTALAKVKWLDIYLCEDVNLAVRLLNEKLTMILDEMAPVKTIQVRNNYAPWLSTATKELMRERDIAQHRAVESKLEADWNKYKSLRNQVNSLVKTEKSSWQAQKMKSIGKNTNLVWKNLKDWFGWKK